uniref:Transmembrane protein with metallophosphoesterase domain-like n=1 Tax=Phallusia mammillata TaxID=59560 RepID=A0A6F9DUK7_9ASCI|nr:transmembrane protein with metallophosphoesterase domain-like [Phallusia mammillata]
MESKPQNDNRFAMITSSLVGICSVFVFEVVVFVALPASSKYKLYRFQFYIVLNIVFYIGSTYLWKNLVTVVLKKGTPYFLKLLWKIVVFTFLLLSHIAPFTTMFLSKDPTFIGMASWTCFGAYIILFFIHAPLKCALDILYQFKGVRLFSARKQAFFAVAATTLFTFWGVTMALSDPRIVRVEIPIKNLPVKSFKLALICDIHLGPTVGYTMLNRVVQKTKTIDADLIVMAGDLTDGTVAEIGEAAMPLQELSAPHGKYFATGNHEYYTGDVDEWFKLLKVLGFQLLHNSNVKIHTGKDENSWFCLLGTDDIQADQVRYKGHGMDLNSAYKGCDSSHASVLVAHQPKAAKQAIDAGFDLQLILSGHTHGGQMYPIKWLAYFISPFLSGLYKHKETYVYVSQGSAYYAFPLRSGSFPEITEISLTNHEITNMTVMLRCVLGFIVFLSVLNASQALPHPNSGNVGGIEVFYNNTIYLISHDKMILPEAYLYCARYGGKLLEIGDVGTEDFMAEIVGRTSYRQFWFGSYRLDVAAILDSWRNLNPLFVNCTTEPDFCTTNTDGPHFDNATYQSTCIADNTCNKTANILLSANGYTNWGPNEPTNESCSLITFSNCDIHTGCNTSQWMMRDCRLKHNFICQKSACPPTDTVPLDPNDIMISSSEYSTYLGANIYCNGRGSAITINYCARTAINLGKLWTGDNKTDPCILHENDQHLTLPRLSSCAPNITNLNESIIYQYLLCGSPRFQNDVTHVIQRRHDIRLSLVCEIDNQATIDSNAMSEQKSLRFFMEPEYGNFDIRIFAFIDSDFTVSAENMSVKVPDPIYIGVKLIESDPATFVIGLVECFAYDTCFCSGLYPFLYQGCTNDSHVTIIEDRNSSRARFSFSSFMWSANPFNDQKIKVICYVGVCDNNYPNSGCRQQVNCPGKRKRRDLGPGEKLYEVHSDVIHLQQPKSCEYNNGGCSHICTDAGIGKTICSCSAPMKLMADETTCYSPSEFDVVDEVDIGEDHLDEGFLEDFSPDISVLLFLVSGLLCIVTGLLFYQVHNEKRRQSL